MLGEQVIILCNIFIIKIGYAKIEEDIQEKRKIEESEVFTEIFISYPGLHYRFNTQYPEWFYEQVKEK